MQTITTDAIVSLQEFIYDSLMSNEDMGMGEMGEAREEANRIISEWMEVNNISEV